MKAASSPFYPPGTLATIVGGIVGAAAGFFIGVPLANAATDDGGGLAALGVALLVVFLAMCIGAGIGAGAGLAIRGHQRPFVTGLISIPAVIAALLSLLGITGELQSALASVLLVFGAAVALWLSRALAMLRPPGQ